jgi:hypothetical protein
MIDYELKQELQSIKTAIEKAKCKFSWWTFWLTGFLFTLGYLESSGLLPPIEAAWYEKAVIGVLMLAAWPVILGQAVGG